MSRPLLSLLLLAVSALCGVAPAWGQSNQLVVWAWERPEDLRFLPQGVEIALQTGFVSIDGNTVVGRGRRFPLWARADQVTTTVVHVQIEHRRPLQWTPALRARTMALVSRLALRPGVRRVQLDFEVRASERQALLDVLQDLRASAPREVRLSMTALASWCEGQGWFVGAPVDEITPMLFRMGHGGAAIRARLQAGGDFADKSCRKAFAISTDATPPRAPQGRRVYLFNPHSWTAGDFQLARQKMDAWDDN